MARASPPTSPQRESATPDTFEEYIAASARRRYLVVGAFIPVVIPLFGFVDLLLYPKRLSALFALRAVLTALGVLTWFIVFLSRRYWPVILASSAGALVTSAGVVLIGHVAEGYASPYFVALALPLTGIACFMEWPSRVAQWVMLLVLLTYFAPAVVLGVPADLPNFIYVSSLVVVLSAMCVAAISVRVTMARRDYEQKRELASNYVMLESLHRTKEQLFQNISHEFRTPLALILAPTETLLAEQGERGSSKSQLSTIRDNALRLLNLINDLLDLGKLDAVGLRSAPESMAVTTFVRALVQQAEPLVQRQGLSLTLESDDAAPVYRLDRRLLEKVLLNLLSNAFKVTPRGGRVTVAVKDDAAEGLRISVRDTGPGIAKAAQPYLFERFGQLDGSSTRSYGGTGIGLALVKELTELLGGSVSLESEPGQGALFSLQFPVSLREAHLTVAETPQEELSAIAAFSRRAAFTALIGKEDAAEVMQAGERGPRVLVAEDDPELRRTLVDILGARHRVTGAPNGRVALELAEQEPPDLLLSDVMMPEVDGLELATRIRKHPRLRELPIVLLSAKADVEDRIAGRKLGIDTYLTKPFVPAEVVATVEGLLRARMKWVGDYLLLGPLGEGAQSQVFRAEHVVTHQQVALKLISKESLDVRGMERLKREGETLRRLRHPNIVGVVDGGFEADAGYLVMELLEGHSLYSLVKARHFLTAGTAVAIAVAVADALATVHAHGLVHRDIKGGNIILVREGKTVSERVRLIDFGVVRIEELATLTADSSVVGTLPYLPEEVLRGASATASSDVYAVGVLLFWMCTGVLPYAGSDRNFDAARLTERLSHLPPALIEVVLRALSPFSTRFSSAEQLRAALVETGLAEQAWAPELVLAKAGAVRRATSSSETQLPTHSIQPASSRD